MGRTKIALVVLIVALAPARAAAQSDEDFPIVGVLKG
jgi:hypothetical protein